MSEGMTVAVIVVLVVIAAGWMGGMEWRYHRQRHKLEEEQEVARDG